MALLAAGVAAAGCGGSFTLPKSPAPLFFLPMEIEGRSIGHGFVDTGGEFEVLLSHPFGLAIVDEIDVLAFGGSERVRVTEPFVYQAGGVEIVSDGAIVGLSACDCNGVGFRFLQKAGKTLRLDFDAGAAELVDFVPPDAVTLEFAEPPSQLSGFRSSFIDMTVARGGRAAVVTALLDTGAATTVLQRGVMGSSSESLTRSRLDVTVAHPSLGVVAASPALFATDGLPDLIIGTDIMGVLGGEWYFTYTSGGGTVAVVLRHGSTPDDDSSVESSARLLP